MAEREGRLVQQGKVLRELREAAGLDQLPMADLLGVSRPTISQWESGKSELRLTDVHSIALVLEIPFGLLLERLGYPMDQPVSFSDWLATRYERKLRGDVLPQNRDALPSKSVKRPGGNRLHSTLRDRTLSPADDESKHSDDQGQGPLIRSNGPRSDTHTFSRAS